MKNFCLFLLMLTACGICADAQTKTTVFSILSKKEPTVEWNAKSQISGDFDYDGTIDYALRGRKGKFFVLGIVKGALSGKSKYRTMKFGEDAGDQGSLCSVKSAIITVDDINKDYVDFASEYLEADYARRLRSVSKNSKGIVISDGNCDAFHIFWDKKYKLFTWWRV